MTAYLQFPILKSFKLSDLKAIQNMNTSIKLITDKNAKCIFDEAFRAKEDITEIINEISLNPTALVNEILEILEVKRIELINLQLEADTTVNENFKDKQIK